MKRICLIVLLGALVQASAKPAVLLITHHSGDWGPIRKLQADAGISFGMAPHAKITWELLQQFNAVVVFDMQRLNELASPRDTAWVTPDEHDRLSELLERYVEAGGGLYLYGVSFTHMGQGLATNALNRLLKRFDAQVPIEMLRDPPQEERQPGGREILYASADRLVPHPVTKDIRHLWYAIGRYCYGPWMHALQLGEAWTPLVLTSPDYTSQPLNHLEGYCLPVDEPSVITGERAVIVAAREFGKGRIVLNGGESTISWFGYDYSHYADEQWQRIGMERGLNDTPSDGLKLLTNSLLWISAPSQGVFGGYTPPVVEPPKPRHAKPLAWPLASKVSATQWQPGLIAVIQAGRLADYVEAAKARDLRFLVAAVEFEALEEADWTRYVDACATLSDDRVVVIPAVATRDHLGNCFLQAGAKSWPKPARMDAEQPTRVRDHLRYWMSDANFPLRVVYRFGDGRYPPVLHSGYNAFALRTWQDGTIIDEPGHAAFRAAVSQGDRPTLVSVHQFSSPERLKEAKELTWLRAANQEQINQRILLPQFHNGLSFVSGGPRVLKWHIDQANRQTYGERHVPGRERWRLNLLVESDHPLKQITIQDGDVTRRYAVGGTKAMLQVDGLHDQRHVLTAIIEDEQGNRAFTGGATTADHTFRQSFCSDRCNIMGGMSTIRDSAGFETIVPASTMLYKAGRLEASAVGIGEALPGVDGSGQGVEFKLGADMAVTTADPALSEERSKIHLIQRPWESADGLVFRTPIAYRSPEPEHLIYGHNPYVELVEPRGDAMLEQYHFYRNPMYPSPALATFSVTAREEPVQTKPGWQGLNVRLANSRGTIKRYLVVRRDGTTEAHPQTDDEVFKTRLEAGDSIYYPDLGEGFIVREGPLDIVLHCAPGRQWFRLWAGRFDELRLQHVSASVVLLRVEDREEEGLAQWQAFSAAFGLTGEPGYSVKPSQGRLTDTQYLLRAEADGYGFMATFQGPLPQRLPLEVSGINPRWTAGLVDMNQQMWTPIGGEKGAVYTTLDLGSDTARKIYAGNLLTTDSPELLLTLLPANDDGNLYADVHNPTASPVEATVRVPITTWLAPQQAHSVSVAAMSTVRLQLHP